MRTRSIALTICLLLAMVTLVGCPPRTTPQTPPPKTDTTPPPATPKTVSLTIEDKHPQGCATCHVKKDDQDYTLPAELKKIENHPQVEAKTVKDCRPCHPKTGDRALSTVLHPPHLGSDTFLTNLGANCVSCHGVTDKKQVTTKGLEFEQTASS